MADIPGANEAPVLFTVRDAMIAAGVNNVALFEGSTAAARLATDIFNDDFDSCLDKSHSELYDDFKTYSEMTVAQGQIRLLPGIKHNVRAFIQWVMDEKHFGRDPRTTPYPAEQSAALLRR